MQHQCRNSKTNKKEKTSPRIRILLDLAEAQVYGSNLSAVHREADPAGPQGADGPLCSFVYFVAREGVVKNRFHTRSWLATLGALFRLCAELSGAPSASKVSEINKEGKFSRTRFFWRLERLGFAPEVQIKLFFCAMQWTCRSISNMPPNW